MGLDTSHRGDCGLNGAMGAMSLEVENGNLLSGLIRAPSMKVAPMAKSPDMSAAGKMQDNLPGKKHNLRQTCQEKAKLCNLSC